MLDRLDSQNRKTVADLKPGDLVRIHGQQFKVKSVDTSGAKTILVFEDVLATEERCDAIRRFAADNGGIAAMIPVRWNRSYEQSEISDTTQEQLRKCTDEILKEMEDTNEEH